MISSTPTPSFPVVNNELAAMLQGSMLDESMIEFCLEQLNVVPVGTDPAELGMLFVC